MSHWTPSRRDLLKATVLGGASVLLPLARLRLGAADQIVTSPRITLFQNELYPVPAFTPANTVTVTLPDGKTQVEADRYLISSYVSRQRVLPSTDGFPLTPVWTYNGQFPGPLFR